MERMHVGWLCNAIFPLHCWCCNCTRPQGTFLCTFQVKDSLKLWLTLFQSLLYREFQRLVLQLGRQSSELWNFSSGAFCFKVLLLQFSFFFFSPERKFGIKYCNTIHDKLQEDTLMHLMNWNMGLTWNVSDGVAFYRLSTNSLLHCLFLSESLNISLFHPKYSIISIFFQQRIALVYMIVALIETFTTKIRPSTIRPGVFSIFTAYKWQWWAPFFSSIF